MLRFLKHCFEIRIFQFQRDTPSLFNIWVLLILQWLRKLLIYLSVNFNFFTMDHSTLVQQNVEDYKFWYFKLLEYILNIAPIKDSLTKYTLVFHCKKTANSCTLGVLLFVFHYLNQYTFLKIDFLKFYYDFRLLFLLNIQHPFLNDNTFCMRNILINLYLILSIIWYE